MTAPDGPDELKEEAKVAAESEEAKATRIQESGQAELEEIAESTRALFYSDAAKMRGDSKESRE